MNCKHLHSEVKAAAGGGVVHQDIGGETLRVGTEGGRGAVAAGVARRQVRILHIG